MIDDRNLEYEDWAYSQHLDRACVPYCPWCTEEHDSIRQRIKALLDKIFGGIDNE